MVKEFYFKRKYSATHTHMHAHTHTCMHMHTHMHTHLHAHTHACLLLSPDVHDAQPYQGTGPHLLFVKYLTKSKELPK